MSREINQFSLWICPNYSREILRFSLERNLTKCPKARRIEICIQFRHLQLKNHQCNVRTSVKDQNHKINHSTFYLYLLTHTITYLQCTVGGSLHTIDWQPFFIEKELGLSSKNISRIQKKQFLVGQSLIGLIVNYYNNN